MEVNRLHTVPSLPHSLRIHPSLPRTVGQTLSTHSTGHTSFAPCLGSARVANSRLYSTMPSDGHSTTPKDTDYTHAVKNHCEQNTGSVL